MLLEKKRKKKRGKNKIDHIFYVSKTLEATMRFLSVNFRLGSSEAELYVPSDDSPDPSLILLVKLLDVRI